MNCFQRIKDACASVGIAAYPDFTTADKETYAVYNIASESPVNFGDDAPQDIITDLQLHLFLPANFNFFDINVGMKQAIFRAGFTFPRVVLNTVEDDKTSRHIVYEFDDAEAAVL